jgi:hypothetical protein
VTGNLSVRCVARTARVSRAWLTTGTEERWFRRAVAAGNVLPEERETYWPHVTGVPILKKEVAAEVGCAPDAVFETLCARPMSDTRSDEIDRDVGRTMPTHPGFRKGSDGRHQLAQILRCCALLHPEVGYCQGMNFVVAVLLLNVRAETAFWIWLAMLRNFHLTLLYAPGVPHLPLRLYQFTAAVRMHLPDLYAYLERNTFSVNMLAHQWVMTLYAYYLEPELLAHIYDVFFLRGWKAFVRTGVALLRALEPRLMELDVEGISGLMQASKGRSPSEVFGSSIAHILRNLDAVKITTRDLLRSSEAYQRKALLQALTAWSPTAEGSLALGFEALRLSFSKKLYNVCPLPFFLF